MIRSVNFIAAIDDRLGIAKSRPDTPGFIPWDLPTDRKYFRSKVGDVSVVMGWNTFWANGLKPYGVGQNTVITDRLIDYYPGVTILHSIQEFFKQNNDDVWVVGGGQIFKQALPYATHLYLTRVEGDFNCNIFFPEFEQDFELHRNDPVQTENGVRFRYQIWNRRIT